jgi:hypothetical protein
MGGYLILIFKINWLNGIFDLKIVCDNKSYTLYQYAVVAQEKENLYR